MPAAAVRARFLVRIHYREPVYEMYAGRKERLYHWTYEIEAPDAEAAKRLALREFEWTSRHSGVGWARQVLRIEAAC